MGLSVGTRVAVGRRRRRTITVVSLTVIAGCATSLTRSLIEPAEMATLDSASPFLKAHLAGGSVYVLSHWSVDSTSSMIVGTGELLDSNRRVVSSGDFRLPGDSVVLFETNVEGRSGANTTLTIMTGITAVVAGICAASPKTCFGSCPTFYAPDVEGGSSLQAEGFSSSIAPGLEATDVDMLLHTRPAGRDYELRLTNEALETHVLRRADLLLAPRPPGGRVFMTSDGRFLGTTPTSSPTLCAGAEGDCLAAVLAPDGDERFSLADSTDLATRETIQLEFASVPEGELGLVLASRQTLMTTFLIYQALAYMGNEAGRWLAGLGSGGDRAREQVAGIGRELGGIEIEVLGPDGRWIEAGSVGETGPLAVDTRVVVLPQVGGGGPLRLRLRLTRGLWRLDHVGLVGLVAEVAPQRVSPTTVLRDGRTAPAARDALIDPEQTLVTLPGDEYELGYRLPDRPDRFEMFLEARGYYLEWMRKEWIAEQNALLAAQLVLDPAAALRMLAPAFKREEPEIENLFWNSRYVRP